MRDVAEAQDACAAGADLVDAKDPDRGALGALSHETVRSIVARVGGAAATSAVAGEAGTADDVVARIAAMAATGVDYVKIAVRPDRDLAFLARAAEAAPGRLIAVLFAEDGVRPEAVPILAGAGFRGAMIDTRGKHGRRLTDHASASQLAAFVAACRAHGLLSGVAGSLRIADVPALAAHEPCYLGFRGGLCRGGDRRDALDPLRVRVAVEAVRALAQRDAA